MNDDVKVCLDLMDERWPGYSTAKYIIRKEIKRLKKANEELLGYSRHIHKARYFKGDDGKMKLTDVCGNCGFDIRHDIHERVK